MNEKEEIENLINESLKKNEKSFRLLIQHIEPEMYKISKIKLKDDELIYEAIQNTIISIYKNLRKLKDKTLFRTWSIKILINECNKIYNKSKKYRKRHIEYNENCKQLSYESFEEIEANLNMKKLLETLNEKEKLVMTLYYNDDFTTREISNILSESEGTIKSRLSRAKNKIKLYIEEENLYE